MRLIRELPEVDGRMVANRGQRDEGPRLDP
jgi:hypothetical protein